MDSWSAQCSPTAVTHSCVAQARLSSHTRPPLFTGIFLFFRSRRGENNNRQVLGTFFRKLKKLQQDGNPPNIKHACSVTFGQDSNSCQLEDWQHISARACGFENRKVACDCQILNTTTPPTKPTPRDLSPETLVGNKSVHSPHPQEHVMSDCHWMIKGLGWVSHKAQP